MSGVIPVVRLAGKEDLSCVFLLIGEYYEFDHLSFDDRIMAGWLPHFLASDRFGIILLAELDAEALGYVMATFSFDLEFGGPLATITDFYVREAYRRFGIGRTLFSTLETELVARGVRTVELQPEASNQRALAFYSSLGFQKLDRIPMVKRISESI